MRIYLFGFLATCGVLVVILLLRQQDRETAPQPHPAKRNITPVAKPVELSYSNNGVPATLRGTLRRTLSEYIADGDFRSVATKLEPALEIASTADLVTLVKDTNFREDGTPILHLLAADFGRRSNKEAVETLAEIYASCSSDDERARLGFLVREIRSPEGLDALQALIVSPNAKQTPAFDPLITSAAFALAASGDPRRAEALLTAASQSLGGPRSSLFNGSLQIESLESLPLILSIANRTHPLSGDEQALQTSVYLLGRIRSEKSRDKLQQLVSSGDPTIAQWAKEAEDNLRSIAPGLYGSE